MSTTDGVSRDSESNDTAQLSPRISAGSGIPGSPKDLGTHSGYPSNSCGSNGAYLMERYPQRQQRLPERPGRRYRSPKSSASPSPPTSSTASPKQHWHHHLDSEGPSNACDKEESRAATTMGDNASFLSAQWGHQRPQVVRDDTHVMVAPSPQPDELSRLVPLHSTVSLTESTGSPFIHSRAGSSASAMAAGEAAAGTKMTASLPPPTFGVDCHADPTRGLTPFTTPRVVVVSPAPSSANNDRDSLAGAVLAGGSGGTPAKEEEETHATGPLSVPDPAPADAAPMKDPSSSPPIPLATIPGGGACDSAPAAAAAGAHSLPGDAPGFPKLFISSALQSSNTSFPSHHHATGSSNLPADGAVVAALREGSQPPFQPSSVTEGQWLASTPIIIAPARGRDTNREEEEDSHAHGESPALHQGLSPAAAASAFTALEGKPKSQVSATSTFTVTTATGVPYGPVPHTMNPAEVHHGSSPVAPVSLTSPNSGAGTPSSTLPRSVSAIVVSSSAPGLFHSFENQVVPSNNNNNNSVSGSTPRYSTRRNRRPAPPIDLSRSATMSQLDRSQNFSTPGFPTTPLHNASGGVVPTVPAFRYALDELPRAHTTAQLGDTNMSTSNNSRVGTPSTGACGYGGNFALSSARSSTSLLSGRSHRAGGGGGTNPGTSFMGGMPLPSLKDFFPGLPERLLLSRERLYVPRDGHKRLGKGAYGEVLQGELYPPGVNAPVPAETPAESFLRSSQMTTPRVSNTASFSVASQQLPLLKHDSSGASCTTPGISPTTHTSTTNLHIPVHLQPYSDATAAFYNGGVHTSDRELLNSVLPSPTTPSRSTSTRMQLLPQSDMLNTELSTTEGLNDAAVSGPEVSGMTAGPGMAVTHQTRSSWNTDVVLLEANDGANHEEGASPRGRDSVLRGSPDSDRNRVRRSCEKPAEWGVRQGHSPPTHSFTVAPALASCVGYTYSSKMMEMTAQTSATVAGPASSASSVSPNARRSPFCSPVSTLTQETASPHSLVSKPIQSRTSCDISRQRDRELHRPRTAPAVATADSRATASEDPPSPTYLRTKRATKAPNSILSLVGADMERDASDCEIDFPPAVPLEASPARGDAASRGMEDSLRSNGEANDDDEHTMNYQSPINAQLQSQSLLGDFEDDADSPLKRHRSAHSTAQLDSASPQAALYQPPVKARAAATGATDLSEEKRPSNATEKFDFDVCSSGDDSSAEPDLEVTGSTAPSFSSLPASLPTSGGDSRGPFLLAHKGTIDSSSSVPATTVAVAVAGTGADVAEVSPHPPHTDPSLKLSPKELHAMGGIPMNRSPDKPTSFESHRKNSVGLSLSDAPAFPALRDTSTSDAQTPNPEPFIAAHSDIIPSGTSENSVVLPCRGSLPSLNSASNAPVGDGELTETARATIRQAAEEVAAGYRSRSNPLAKDDSSRGTVGKTLALAAALIATLGRDGDDDTTPQSMGSVDGNATGVALSGRGGGGTGNARGTVSPGAVSLSRDFGQTVSTEASLAATNNTLNLSWANHGLPGTQSAQNTQRDQQNNQLAEFRSTDLGEMDESHRDSSQNSHSLSDRYRDAPQTDPAEHHRPHTHLPTMSNMSDVVAAGAIPFRSVAIKTFLKSDLYRREFAQSLHNEMTIASQLRHACLVNVFGIAEEADRVLLVMDLAEKGNVDQYMKKFGVADTREMAPRFVADVVLLLEYFRDSRRHPYKASTGIGTESLVPPLTSPGTGSTDGSGDGVWRSRRRARLQHLPPVLSAGGDALTLTAVSDGADSSSSSQKTATATPVKSGVNSTAPNAEPTSTMEEEEGETASAQNRGGRGSIVRHEGGILPPRDLHDERDDKRLVSADESEEFSTEEEEEEGEEADLPELSEEEMYKGIVVHRDLKPENMLLTWDYHVKLGDFGSGCFLGDDEANRFGGTPAYIAPEVLVDSKAGPNTDLWALGCVIYELTVGHPAFRGSTPFLITRQIKSYLKGEFQLSFEDVTAEGKTGGEYPGSPTTADAARGARILETARDIVEKLLVAKPEDRLGSEEQGGIAALKRHPFFSDIDWRHVLDTPNITPTNTNYTEELTDYLEEGEKVVYCSPVDLLRDSTGLVGLGLGDMAKSLVYSRSPCYRTKVLVLTDAPRLFLVDSENGEIAFTIPWTHELLVQVERTDFFSVLAPSCGRFNFRDRNRRADLWGIKTNDLVRKAKRTTAQHAVTPLPTEAATARRTHSVDLSSAMQKAHSLGGSRNQLSISLVDTDRDLHGNSTGSYMSHHSLINRLRLTPSSGSRRSRSHANHARTSSLHQRQHSASSSFSLATTAMSTTPPAQDSLPPFPIPSLPQQRELHHSAGASCCGGSGFPSTAPTAGLGSVIDCTGRPHTARTPTKATASASVLPPTSAAAAGAASASHQPLRSPSTITVTVASTNNADARLATPTTVVSHSLPAPPPLSSSVPRLSSSIHDPQTPLGRSFSPDDIPSEEAESSVPAGEAAGISPPPSSHIPPALTATTAGAAAAASLSQLHLGVNVSASAAGVGSTGTTPRTANENCITGGGGDSCLSEGLSDNATELSATPRQPLTAGRGGGGGGAEGGGIPTVNPAIAGDPRTRHAHTLSFTWVSGTGTPPAGASLPATSTTTTTGPACVCAGVCQTGNSANAAAPGACGSGCGNCSSGHVATNNRSAVTKEVFQRRKKNRSAPPTTPEVAEQPTEDPSEEE